MISEKRIIYLFDNLWPHLENCIQHRETCMQLYPKIQFQFIENCHSFDSLLYSLMKYDGIGISIATGLIWTAYPNRAVPFDRYTTSWCLHKKYIQSNNISENYSNVCSKVIKALKVRKKPITVEELFREAFKRSHELIWSIEPE